MAISRFSALIHGTEGLEVAYVLVLAALLIGLVHGRSDRRRLLLSPVLALPVVLVAAVGASFARALLQAGGSSGKSVVQATVTAAVSVLIGYTAGRLLAQRRGSSDSVYRRGAVVARAQGTDSAERHDRITLAGVPLAREHETKHFKLIGTTGTGKSTAIREILSAALARGDRAVIADPDGGFLARFYDAARGDVILSPFDGEAHKWDLFAEITNDYDVEQLARSLIPDSGDPDRTWTEYARTFFTAVAQQAIEAGVRNDGELYRLLRSAPVEELRKMLAGTAAGPFLEEGNEKMFGSLRSVASSAVRALKYTVRQRAPGFSVRRWVREGGAMHTGGKGGVLFLPYKAGEIAALGSVISAWIRLGIFEAMDCSEGDQRLWFVVDELDVLGEIDGLKDALARLRKFGGRCILGFQSIAQVSGTYGRGAAETIIENCANTLILRCSASEHGGTSEFASKLIGQRDVLYTTSSRTRRSGEWRTSTTSAQHIRTEPAVMASEIERLPDLAGFLKVASEPDWRAVTLMPDRKPPPPRVRRPAVITPD